MKERIYYIGGTPHLNVEGKKGESLFHRLLTVPSRDDFERINKRYKKYSKFIHEAKDERLLALIGSLSMEEALDLFLGAYIPDYSHLGGNRDFSLSMKIDMAYSLRLIPRHILNTADMIRKVRNEFAHDLSIDCFDSLNGDKFKSKLRAKFNEFFPDDDISNVPLSKLFEQVVEIIVSTLGLYQIYIESAKEYIYSEDFSKQLVERIKAKSG